MSRAQRNCWRRVALAWRLLMVMREKTMVEVEEVEEGVKRV